MEEIVHRDPDLIERLEFLELKGGSCSEDEWYQSLQSDEGRGSIRTRAVAWEP